MTDTFRYKYGESNPVSVAWKAGSAVAVGDCCFVDTSDNHTVKSAANFTWTTDLPTTQAAFVAEFLGVSAQRYDGVNGNAYGISDGKLRVDTQGVYEFDTTDSSHNVGDLVGLAQGTGNTLNPQAVTSVSDAAHAIGRVADATYTQYGSVNRVKVRIMTQLQQVDH